mgnify:CR=1 FL=1
MSLMRSSPLRGYVHALPSPALKDHSLLQNGSDIHHYARAHLPVRYSRRSKKPFLGSTGSVISKTRRKLSEPSLEFVDVPSCYDIPSGFEFFSPSQLQRPQSSWARSSGRSSRLDPNGLNYVAASPYEAGFDGHHLGPGSYTSPLAKSGSVVLSRTVGLSSVSARGRMLVSRH